MLQSAIGSNHHPITRLRNWPRFDFWRRSDLAASSPVASLPDEKNVSCDQPNDDEHPVLTFETQKGEMLDEKLHRSRPLFVQDRRFSSKNILFLYFNIAEIGFG
jgi:hypothetical protein